MKRLTATFCLLVPLMALSQSVSNFGNLQLHDGALVGIHENLNNQGNLNTNSTTMVGFYGQEPNTINGLPFTLYDTEFANESGAILLTQLNVINNLNFISSSIISPYDNDDAFVNFLENSFYTGEGDFQKIVGFAGTQGKSDFVFPIGFRNQLRPLSLESESANTSAKSAYLFENPDNPNSINASFDVNSISNGVGFISSNEFWLLSSDVASTVTLTWNLSSNLGLIATELSEIIIVGWDIGLEQWVPLSGQTGTGDLNEGSITSTSFLPNDYAAITFGTIPLPLDTFAVNNPTLGDYFLSPNNDGINEGLVFDDLEEGESNVVRIFNKFGHKVFEKKDYVDEFKGVANTGNLIIKQELGLPEGVYYYTIDLPDLNLAYQGFLFLDR